VIVRWTERAEADLNGQCDHIARDDPAMAVRMGTGIFSAIETLARFPYRGRAGRVAGTRELVLVGLPWIAVYAITDDMIVVLRLLHGAKAYPVDEV